MTFGKRNPPTWLEPPAAPHRARAWAGEHRRGDAEPDRGTVVQTVAQTLGREQVAVASRSSAISNGLVIVLLALSALFFAVAAASGRAVRLAPGRLHGAPWVTTARFVAAAGGAFLAAGAAVGWLARRGALAARRVWGRSRRTGPLPSVRRGPAPSPDVLRGW